MELNRLATKMVFVKYVSTGKMASKSCSFMVGKELLFEWKNMTNEDVKNYFLKDD